MKKYTVQITDDAIKDMEELYDYIAENLQSLHNAKGQYERIAKGILSLDVLPERYRILEFENGGYELRRMPIDNYSVFYCIFDDHVIVTNVLYSASDIEQKLKRK